MLLRKISQFSLIFGIIFAATRRPANYMEVKVRKVACKFSDMSLIYPNYTCFAKVYSRNVSTATVYYVLRKPIFSFYVRNYCAGRDFLNISFRFKEFFLTATEQFFVRLFEVLKLNFVKPLNLLMKASSWGSLWSWLNRQFQEWFMNVLITWDLIS